MLSECDELVSILSTFLSKSRFIRRKANRHAKFTIPEKFYWDATFLKPEGPEDAKDLKQKIVEEKEAIDWLREVEPYWARFFGEFTLSESAHIAAGEVCWKADLLDELNDDSMIIINNLALEIDFMELETETIELLINTYLTLAASRASQNEVPKSNDRQVEPVSTYR